MLCLTLHFFFCLVLEGLGFPLNNLGILVEVQSLPTLDFHPFVWLYEPFHLFKFVGKVNCLMTL